MKWIRRNIRSGAWLALTALALHLVLTFGHIHAERFSPSPSSVAAASVAATDARAADDGDAAATERYRSLRAHLHCAICTSISLSGTSLLPAGQTLAPPPAVPGSRKLNPSDTAPPHEQRCASKARAPPSA
jgi:hypothetical protein